MHQRKSRHIYSIHLQLFRHSGQFIYCNKHLKRRHYHSRHHRHPVQLRIVKSNQVQYRTRKPYHQRHQQQIIRDSLIDPRSPLTSHKPHTHPQQKNQHQAPITNNKKIHNIYIKFIYTYIFLKTTNNPFPTLQLLSHTPKHTSS